MKKLILSFVTILFICISVFASEETVFLPSQTAVIQNVQYVDVDNAAVQTIQKADVKILSGKNKGEIVELENVLTGNPYYDIKLKKGVKVILHAEDNGNGIEYSIEDIKRSGVLVFLAILFASLLIYIGREKGLLSLVSIIITVLLISYCQTPLILAGVAPIFATMLICIFSTVITMYFVGGFNAKSSSAASGAILSVIFAGILSYTTMLTAHLTGFVSENSVFLYSAHPELDFVGLTVSAMMLATLGAVMDVAMSISSTINEIHLTDSTKKVKDLFISGMNVGRDIIGTMANTLILVYMGGSLPLILLAGNIDMQKFINLNQVVTEIASALIGSIAIVLCVPFTAIVSAIMIKKYSKYNEEIKIDND